MDGRDLLIQELKQDIAKLDVELKQMIIERDDAIYRLTETQKSFSYRLGLVLTSFPRKIRKKN